MVSVLFSGSSGAGSMEQWSGTLHVSVVFLGKTLYSRSASLHPGTGDIYAGGSPNSDRLASHPRGSRNTHSRFMLQKLGPDRPLGLYADFTFLPIYHRMEKVLRIKKKQASNVSFYFLHSLQKTAEE